MAIVKMDLPKCDICQEPWLPDKYLPGGQLNPARENPRLSRRCGKCKTTRWNHKERTPEKRELAAIQKGQASPEKSDPVLPTPNGAGLEKLYGILAKDFKELGGGEAFLKEERNWGPDVWEKYELEEKTRRERKK